MVGSRVPEANIPTREQAKLAIETLNLFRLVRITLFDVKLLVSTSSWDLRWDCA